MANNKNQHFVPQFYLRRFSRDGSSIAVFNLAGREHHPTASIKGQCAKPYFYGRNPKVEEAIQGLEQMGAAVIRDILASDEPPRKGSLPHHRLVSYVMTQWGRTPEAASEQEAFATEFVRRIVKTQGALTNPSLMEHAESIRVRYEDPVRNAMKLALSAAPMLFDLECKLIVNDSPLEFATSDVAVVLHNRWCEGISGSGTTGFASRGLMVLLPISPRRLVLLYDGSVYQVGNPGMRVVRFQDEHDANVLNEFQYASAHKNLYYSGDQATARALDAMTIERAPRSMQVQSHRATSAPGEERSELIHMYREALPVRADLAWLRINKAMQRVASAKRARSWRTEAHRMDDRIRDPRERRYKEPPGHVSRTWHLVPDE